MKIDDELDDELDNDAARAPLQDSALKGIAGTSPVLLVMYLVVSVWLC